MNPRKISQIVLEKIKKEHIKPRSKYFFITINIFFWFVFFASIVIGALSFSVILFAFQYLDFELWNRIKISRLDQFLTLLPFFWIFLIGLMVGFGIWGLRHTNRGYRITFNLLIVSNILGSIFLGGGVYALGGAEVIEDTIHQKVKFYKTIGERHRVLWTNPQETGFLGGMVTNIDLDTKTLKIQDLNQNFWDVDYTKAIFKHPRRFELKVDRPVRMEGTFEEDTFFAQRIWPARGKHKRLKKHLQRFKKRHHQNSPHRRNHPKGRKNFRSETR